MGWGGVVVLVVGLMASCSSTKSAEDEDEEPEWVQEALATANEATTNTPVIAKFVSANETLGTWTVSAVKCLAGTERGFEGIWFGFAAGDPIEEIRFDTTREGDVVIEFRLADRSGTVYRVRESECEAVGGSIDSNEVILNGRDMLRLVGAISFQCPSQKVEGAAKFDGCLPL